MYRLTGVLSGDVPECVVHGAERHREQPAASIEERRAVHLVPELLDVERVGVDQQMLQVPVDDLDRGAAAGPHPEAGDALVGLDDGDDGRRQLFERSAVAPATGVVIRGEGWWVQQTVRALVDVDWIGVHGANGQSRVLLALLG